MVHEAFTLFAKGCFKLDQRGFRELETNIKVSDPLEQRQLLICAGLNGVRTLFRKNRTSFDMLNEWAKPAFIYGAKCLERDEFDHWTKSIKPRLERSFGPHFLKWVKDR